MTQENICPGCGRRCDLSAPHCDRGKEYSRTGKMPEQKHKGDSHHEAYISHYDAADINDKIIMNIRNISCMMRFLYEGKASQKRILIILKEAERMTQRDLTERLGIQPGSASEILSKLESAGLIVRTQNETDRRTTDICLTDSGRELAAEAFAQRQKRHEEMFSCLSEEEKQKLLSLLECICADWKTRYGANGNLHGHRHPHEHPHEHHGPHGHRDGSHGHGGN